MIGILGGMEGIGADGIKIEKPVYFKRPGDWMRPGEMIEIREIMEEIVRTEIMEDRTEIMAKIDRTETIELITEMLILMMESGTVLLTMSYRRISWYSNCVCICLFAC